MQTPGRLEDPGAARRRAPVHAREDRRARLPRGAATRGRARAAAAAGARARGFGRRIAPAGLVPGARARGVLLAFAAFAAVRNVWRWERTRLVVTTREAVRRPRHRPPPRGRGSPRARRVARARAGAPRTVARLRDRSSPGRSRSAVSRSRARSFGCSSGSAASARRPERPCPGTVPGHGRRRERSGLNALAHRLDESCPGTVPGQDALAHGLVPRV